MPDTPYVAEEGGLVKIGNERIELGFDADRQGALVSLVDRESGYQFIRDEEAPKALFRLAVRRPDRELEWIEGGDAEQLRWTQEESEGAVTLCLRAAQFGSRPPRGHRPGDARPRVGPEYVASRGAGAGGRGGLPARVPGAVGSAEGGGCRAG